MTLSNLGKRKRPASGLDREAREASGTSCGGQHDVHAIFKQHFEARFKPLTLAKTPAKEADKPPEPEDGDDIEWEGISDNESIEVVEHTTRESRIVMPKEELKAFMGSRPPKDGASGPAQENARGGKVKEDPEEADNLKKDLALQRLLAESHLLESSSSLTPSGTNRHKAIELRLQTLGSKTAISTQEKMPMSHRKGITAKQRERESRRRKEARENGIILEKAKGDAKRQKEGRRNRDIGGPGVGRFSGGTLRLSKRDILDIEGLDKAFNKKGARGSRSRGSRGRRGGSRRI